MCGVEDKLVNAVVEGSILLLCNRCKEFGDVIEIPKQKVVQLRPKQVVEEPEEFIVSDYNEIVRNAREKMGLMQKDLAEKINEKESLIQKIESGHMQPSPDLARKLERFLGIKLVEKYSAPNDKSSINFKDKGLTIGDLVRLKRKKE